MSDPHAKRRRLNEAAKTLQRPFKSPFRTSEKPAIGPGPLSSDSPASSTPASVQDPLISTTSNGQDPQIATGPSTSYISKPLTPRQTTPTPSRLLSRKKPSNSSLTREIMQHRSDIQMLTQAYALATSTTDEELVILIDTWRTASRAAAEELFDSTRDRVNNMGGVGAWRKRERETKELHMKWNQEEIEAEREKTDETRESWGMAQHVCDKHAHLDEEEIEKENDAFNVADDEPFTMDMMLNTLNIDLSLIGYDKEAQRWHE